MRVHTLAISRSGPAGLNVFSGIADNFIHFVPSILAVPVNYAYLFRRLLNPGSLAGPKVASPLHE
jgi:hypothetical protein